MQTLPVVFTPVRLEGKLTVANKVNTTRASSGLDTFHRSELMFKDGAAGAAVVGLKCFKFSGYSRGMEVAMDKIDTEALRKICPDYLVKEVGERKDVGPKGAGNCAERKHAAVVRTEQEALDGMALSVQQQAQVQRDCGLFPCGHVCPRTQSACCFVFSTQRGLDRHNAPRTKEEEEEDDGKDEEQLLQTDRHRATTNRKRGGLGLGAAGSLAMLAAQPGSGIARGDKPNASKAVQGPPVVAAEVQLSAAAAIAEHWCALGQFTDPAPRHVTELYDNVIIILFE